MDTCKPASTILEPHAQLLVSEGSPMADPTLYRNLVEALQYQTFTRPDIHLVNVFCQYMIKHTDAHFFLVKRILRYLQRTSNCGLTYTSSSGIHSFSIFKCRLGSKHKHQKSITRYVVFLGSQRSKRSNLMYLEFNWSRV